MDLTPFSYIKSIAKEFLAIENYKNGPDTFFSKRKARNAKRP